MKNILMATFWILVFFSIFYVLTMGNYGLLILIPVILSLYSYITKRYTKDFLFNQKNITILYKKTIFYKFFFKGIPFSLSKNLTNNEIKDYSYRFFSFISLFFSIIILSFTIVVENPNPSFVNIEEGRIARVRSNLFLNYCGKEIVDIIYNDGTKERFFCQINIGNTNKILKEFNYKLFISRNKKFVPFCNTHDTIIGINGPEMDWEYNDLAYKRLTQALIFSQIIGFITLLFSISALYPMIKSYKIRNNNGEK